MSDSCSTARSNHWDAKRDAATTRMSDSCSIWNVQKKLPGPEKLHSKLTKYCTCHNITPTLLQLYNQRLHLPRKVILQPPCIFTKHCTCHEECHCNFTKVASAMKSGFPSTSPNTAPATKNDIRTSLLHQILRLRRKVIFQYHVNVTENSICHEKWYWNITPSSPNITYC